MKITHKLKLNLIWLVVLFLVLLNAICINAATFDWNPMPPTTFNLTEDQFWQYNVNVTCSESFVNFSMEETPYDNLTINKDNGLMTFTPTNDDIIKSPGPYLIIVRNISDADDALYKNVYFNISNVNDPPNITSYYPVNLPQTINENEKINFNFTATDPDIQLGVDNISNEWYINSTHQSGYDNLSNYSYTAGYCDAGVYNFTVIVFDTSNEYDYVNWTITVIDVNRDPVFNKTINNLTWSEDNNVTNNITLFDHFYDDDYLYCNNSNNNTLVFNYTISDGNLTIVINQTTGNVSYYPAEDWQGNVTVIFTLDDGTSIAQSNLVYINITGTPDSPELYLVNQSWVGNVSFSYQVNATDPDLPYGDSITFNYTVINNTLSEFYMNSSGYINFTPNSNSTGNHSINITVVDSTGRNVTGTLIFEVKENNNPVIFNVSDQTINESTLFEINISGYDVDGDSINFSSNFTAFNYSIINATITTFFFTPNQSHVGNQSILFIVNDTFGAINTTIMNLEVLNTNNFPVLDEIGNFTYKINKSFILYVNATDTDLDPLNFSDNSTFFNITTLNATTGRALISFIYVDLPGNFSVNISVTDNIFTDFEIVWFELTYNRDPEIDPIPTQYATTGEYFELNVSGVDLDGDDITFTTNHSRIQIIKINRTLSTFYFVPIINETGLNNISVSADDGDGGNDTIIFTINITYVNHAPFFVALENTTCNINQSCVFNVTGYDVDGTELNFSTIPNMFNISNAALTANSTIAQFNFTPWNFSVSSFIINVSITDGNLTNSSNFTIFVNRYPIINATYPNTTQPINIVEGDSFIMNITAYDADGDNLIYFWLMNSSLRGNLSSWTLIANYSSAGEYIITAIASDGAINTSVTWNLTINNSNQAPEFGIYRHTSEADFSSGNFTYVNASLQSGNITLAKNASGEYYAIGTYISATITMPKEYWANVSLTNISWTQNIPAGTNLTVQTRSSRNSSIWTNWSSSYTNPLGSQIVVPDQKYVQYKVTFTTNDSSVTPVLEDLTLKYIIPNFTGVSSYYYWIDLDDYFSDPDGQILTYSASPVQNIDIIIYSNGEVELRPNPTDWHGTRTVVFNATDGENTSMSNTVKIILTAPSYAPIPTPVVIYGGGGGGGTSIRTRTMVMNITEQIYLDLVTPGPLKMGPNQTISVPITLRNKGTTMLRGINLKYEINATTNVSLEFKDEYFNQLLPTEQKKTELIIKSDTFEGSYSITIKADVTEPQATDSAIVHLEILDNFTERVNSVRDLLKLHPECLELQELLVRAEAAINSQDYTKAGLLLDSAIEGCRYLVSSSGKILELQKATKISEIDIRIVAGIVFVIVMLLLIIYYLAVTRNSGKVT